MRSYILLLFAILSIAVPALSAFGMGQVYSANSGTCATSSHGNLTCMDGKPIVLGISLTAQQYPYYFYGNFTARVPLGSDYWDPVNVYGDPCIVPSSSTTVCFLTLPPIPMTALNGTVTRNITLIIQSNAYPQINFTVSSNILINHYVNATTYKAVSFYNQTMGDYNRINPVYEYFCISYKICNSSIGSSLSYAGTRLSGATAYLNNGEIEPAYADAIAANLSLQSVYGSFNAFSSMANLIVNNNLKAQYLATNATVQFKLNQPALYKCNSAQANKLNASINALKSLPIINTTAASAEYLQTANATQKNVTAAIKSCTTATTSSSGTLGLFSGQSISGKGAAIPVGYLLMLPVLVIALYLVIRIRETREAQKLRDAANTNDNEKFTSAGMLSSDAGKDDDPDLPPDDPAINDKPVNEAKPDAEAKPEPKQQSSYVPPPTAINPSQAISFPTAPPKPKPGKKAAKKSKPGQNTNGK